MNGRWASPLGGPPLDFWIEVEPDRDTVKLVPAGELDIATVERLRSELDDVMQGRFERIVIDLRRIEFIDSTGLHALLETHERAKAHGRQLSLVPARDSVQKLFEITGTSQQLPFTRSSNGPGNAEARKSQLPQRAAGVEHAGKARNQPLADPSRRTEPRSP